MRIRVLTVATATLLLNVVGPANGHTASLDRAAVIGLVKQVWAAGTWDEQRAAFDRLPEPARVAVWKALIDVRPGPVQLASVDDADRQAGPCQFVNTEEPLCDYAPAPKPQPTAKPGTKPSEPPVVTPPRTECTWERAYVGYEILGESQLYAFVYAAQLNWCYLTPSLTGPLTDYSSYSFAANCCKFPWTTDPSKYIDKLTPLPASNTQKIQDHHTGWFEAQASLGPIAAGARNAPNIDASVGPDGSYVCNGF